MELHISSIMLFQDGFINVLSPGNYIRHDSYATEYNVLGAAIDTLQFSFDSLQDRVFNTPLLAIILLAFVVAVSRIRFKEFCLRFDFPITFTIVCFLGVEIIDFPVILGTGVAFDRCLYVQDIAIYVLGMFWMVYVCGFVQKRVGIIELPIRHIFIMIFGFSMVTLGINRGVRAILRYI